MSKVTLGIQEQQTAQHRQQHNNDQPRDLGAVVHAGVEQVNDHYSGKQRRTAQVMRQQLLKLDKQPKQHSDLQQQKQKHDAKPAEDGADDALLSLFQQAQAAIFDILDLFLYILLQSLCLHSTYLLSFLTARRHSTRLHPPCLPATSNCGRAVKSVGSVL